MLSFMTAANAAPAMTNVPNTGIFFDCLSYSNGQACIDPLDNGFDAAYVNTTSITQKVDFNLVLPNGVHIGDQGAFLAAPGSTHTYFFAVGYAPYGYDHGYIGVYSRPPMPGWEIDSATEYQP